MTKRTGRCLCGLKVAYHYSSDNRRLSCPDARAAHPRAKVAARSLRVLLCAAGAVPARTSAIVTGLRRGALVGAIIPGGAA